MSIEFRVTEEQEITGVCVWSWRMYQKEDRSRTAFRFR